MSKAHIVVGMTDTGKSYYVKNTLLNKVPNKGALFIYDINHEYKDFFPYELIYFEDFAEKALQLRNSVIVFEEATIFLDGRTITDRHIKQILALKKHHKNYIILVFHSIAEIPRYVYRLCNYITVFKTNEEPKYAIREIKDFKLLPVIEKVRKHKNIHYNQTFKII